MSGSRAADDRPARTNPEARKRFLKYLRLSLGTVSPNAHWVTTSVQAPGGLLVAETIPTLVPMRCTTNERLYLWSTIQFAFVDHPERPNERKVSTRHYSHSIFRDEAAQDEVFSWQWHPLAVGPTYPHLHVHGDDLLGRTLHKLHLPTGRVFLEDVLLFLIEEEIVTEARDDARTVLRENLARLHRHGTWGTRPVP